MSDILCLDGHNLEWHKENGLKAWRPVTEKYSKGEKVFLLTEKIK